MCGPTRFEFHGPRVEAYFREKACGSEAGSHQLASGIQIQSNISNSLVVAECMHSSLKCMEEDCRVWLAYILVSYPLKQVALFSLTWQKKKKKKKKTT
mmetsp:Transcript_20621/g.28988  ORF Transcript_20621/g.28988 Transcript_20621/m.28988 type:complete len:98 (-) Transcript_20621:15-308(-)